MTEKTNNSFSISIAGHVIAIHAIYTDVLLLCRDYLTDVTPEIQIEIEQNEIEKEHEKDQEESIWHNDGYLETLVAYRKICEEMIDYNTFLMHGAVIAVNNNAYMFTAESGTGKTTHIRKWLDHIDNCFVVNGDKPLIRITNTQAIACGTPWCGKELMNTNIMVPLKAIVIMERADCNEIEEISFQQGLIQLLQQTYRPSEAEKLRKTLSLLTQLNGRVRFFKFCFNNYKDDAFEVAYKALTTI